MDGCHKLRRMNYDMTLILNEDNTPRGCVYTEKDMYMQKDIHTERQKIYVQKDINVQKDIQTY